MIFVPCRTRVATLIVLIIFRIKVATLTDVGTFLDQGYYPNQRMLFWIRVATLIDFSRRKKKLAFFLVFLWGRGDFFWGGESGWLP